MSFYYEVAVGTPSYHGTSPLIYSSRELHPAGSVVSVPFRNSEVAGIILAQAKRPDYATKDINNLVVSKVLPAPLVKVLGWLMEYYPAPLGNIASLFLPAMNFSQPSTKNKIVTKSARSIASLPPLTKEQDKAVKRILAKPSSMFVIHGITGSGKTRIYQEIANQKYRQGKNVIILTPEISLTTQLIKGFENYTKFQVFVLHSNLTPKQKRETWLEIHNASRPALIIGPRSALFAPIDNLGLIVLDEAHDSAYKQEQAPYYKTDRVAAVLAKNHKANLIIGTATPDIADYYYATAKGTEVINMNMLAIKAKVFKQAIEIVSIKDRTAFSKHPYLCDNLVKSIAYSLKKREQSLIFLNRRGSARQILCQACGWQQLCPKCDLPLTYHLDIHKAICHTCGYKAIPPSLCPTCGNSDIIYRGIGTKYVETQMQRFWPGAVIRRFDSDNKKSERLEHSYEEILSGRVDILVGTQLLTKGLDLPRLSLVGVLNADSAMSFPDYTADEKSYQQISQILGRIGRGHIAGKAILQTYSPDSQTIKLAKKADWQTFYKTQLQQRRLYGFPPYCYLLKLTVTRKTEKSAQESAIKFAAVLNSNASGIKILGPVQSFRHKSPAGYRWQIVIKSSHRKRLIDILNVLPSGWNYDLDPNNLL